MRDERPRLLDLFCCEGGAGWGYTDAGFNVTGVDITRQRRYPYTFIQGDALELLADPDFVAGFDVIHASPPCQAYSITKHSHNKTHPDLLDECRRLLLATGKPYVIENVPGAPLLQPLTLCGAEFDLTAEDDDGTKLVLRRHRLFESNVLLMGNGGCRCGEYRERGFKVGGVYGGGSADRQHAQFVRRGGYTPSKAVRGRLLGIDWMTLHGLSQSIPPAYTAHIGAQLLQPSHFAAGVGVKV